MAQFTSKYNTDNLVEIKGDAGAVENRFGFIRGVTFRRYDAVNHCAVYTVHLVNEAKVIDDVNEDEIIALYEKRPVK